MVMLDSSGDQIFTHPLGIPHKRMDRCMFPACVDLTAIASLKNTWKPQNATYFVVPRMMGPPFSQGLELCIALAEQWAPEQMSARSQPEFWNNFSGKWAHPGVQLMDAFCTPAALLPDDMRSHMSRCVEWLAQDQARSTSAGMRAQQTSEGRKCFITKLPPSLMPAVKAGNIPNKFLIQTNLASDIENEIQDSRQEQIAVLCADPRYLIMSEFKLLTGISKEYSKAAPAPPGRLWGADDNGGLDEFLEFSMQSKTVSSPLTTMIEWAKLEAKRPSHVKLFFMEDFLRTPDIMLSSLYDFLGLQTDSSESPLLDHVTQETQRCLCSCQPLFGQSGADGIPELQDMQNMVQQFEAYLALNPSAAMAWGEQISELLQFRSIGFPSHGSTLLPSLPWWWDAHKAGRCKPCCFARRGICRNLGDCGFCHGVPHEPAAARPSRKTRVRRDRQNRQRQEQLRCRTPSPSGLSS
eukprot:TRINITY_DN10451_c0_g1_i1.p1 TRINITY_DN10451_c0_g1~~TRINITY_DN10451_c0_g1_i1.p1  ORF type:complete len:466 (-),score=87.11 TRINITY_DN10451_c0_g1_i1:214-1611(-)